MIAPILVRRSSSPTPPGAVSAVATSSSAAAGVRMERNFSIWNSSSSRPTRPCLQVQDAVAPSRSRRRAREFSMIGESSTSAIAAAMRSIACLDAALPARQSREPARDERYSPERLHGHSLGGTLVEPRNKRRSYVKLLAALEQAKEHVAGRGRERDDHVFDGAVAHHALKIPAARSDHRNAELLVIIKERLLGQGSLRCVKPNWGLARRRLATSRPTFPRTDNKGG